MTNVPHYATNAVAEKCVMMALALAKKLPLFEQEGKMNWIRNLSVRIYGVSQQILWGLERLVERWRRSWMGSWDGKRFVIFHDMIMILRIITPLLTKCSSKASICLLRFRKMRIVANGFEEVAERMARMVERGELGGVAFESDDPSRKYKGNVFVTPKNAYYTKEALEKMFEIWVETMMSTTNEMKNKVN